MRTKSRHCRDPARAKHVRRAEAQTRTTRANYYGCNSQAAERTKTARLASPLGIPLGASTGATQRRQTLLPKPSTRQTRLRLLWPCQPGVFASCLPTRFSSYSFCQADTLGILLGPSASVLNDPLPRLTTAPIMRGALRQREESPRSGVHLGCNAQAAERTKTARLASQLGIPLEPATDATRRGRGGQTLKLSGFRSGETRMPRTGMCERKRKHT